MAKRAKKVLHKSISYWSFPGGMENRADVLSVLAACRELAFESLELGISDTGALTTETNRSECRALARAGEACGVAFSALATNLLWAANLAAHKASERDSAVELTCTLIEKAKWLGTDTLVVIPGWVRSFFNPGGESVPYDEALENSRKSLRKCLKFAEKQKINLALLNAWSGLLLSPVEFAQFIDRFRNRRITACLDLGNATLGGYPQHWISILGRRISRVRVRDVKLRFEKNCARNRAFRGFTSGMGWGLMASYCELGCGSVKWEKVMAALARARYKGPLTALSHPPAADLIRRTADFLDKLIGMQ